MTREILPATMCEISQKFIGGPADTMQQCRSKEFSKLRARTACSSIRWNTREFVTNEFYNLINCDAVRA